MEKLKVAVIGLGKMNTEDHIPAIMESGQVELMAVCDADEGRVHAKATELGIDGFTDVKTMLEEKHPDFAVVAVPHDAYLPILKILAAEGVDILKEKPFARNLVEAKEIAELIENTGVKLLVTLQRRYNPIFKAFEQLRERLGRVFHFDARYTLNIGNLESGWRSSLEAAGGGCLIDMGYHTTDLLMWYFGLPHSVQCTLSGNNRDGQDYEVEDTCSVTMDYGTNGDRNGQRLFGNMFLSRVFPDKSEQITVLGTNGSVEIARFGVTRRDNRGEVKDQLLRSGDWPSAFVDQIDQFAHWVKGEPNQVAPGFREHFKHVALIEAAYRSGYNGGIPVNPHELLLNLSTNAKSK